MSPKLYKLDFSPPARACMMACDIFHVNAQLIDINIMAQEHKTSEYLQMNPLHTVPVLEDGNLILHDSHAILMYLADVYGKEDSWYPKDVKQRVLVNQKLFFDTSIIFPLVKDTITSAAKEGERKLSEKRKKEIKEAYGFLEEFLMRSEYIAGDNMSIADLSVISTVTQLFYIFPHDCQKYPKTTAWVKKMESQPFCKKYNEPGLRVVGNWMKSLIEL